MSTKFNRKPPPVKSPIRTRPTRAVRYSTSVSVQIPPGSMRKSAVLIRGHSAKKMNINPELDSVSCDMQALAHMVTGTNGVGLISPVKLNKSPLFERGRFYDLYSAKRNEKLKRKLVNITKNDHLKKCYGKYELGLTPGTLKRMDSKKLESRRKSLPVDSRSQTPRYSLRSGSKVNTKAVLSVSFNGTCGADDGRKMNEFGRRVVVRKI